MKRNIITSDIKNPHSLLHKLFLMLLLSLPAAHAIGQDAQLQTLKGTVRFSEDNEPAPGVNIFLKGSPAIGTYSDAKGQFLFPHSLRSGDVLIFSLIGRESTEYIVLDQNADPIEIVMMPDPIQMVEDVLVEGEDESASTRRFRFFRRTSNR